MKLVEMASARAVAAAVRAGSVSAETVCINAFARAEETTGVFWTLNPRAFADAAEVDRRIAAGSIVGPLAGVPVAVKDNFAVAGLPSSLGVREDFLRPRHDAVTVSRLREAGAVVIGKTAMDQLAWSMDGSAPGYPTCANPLRPGRSTGGSSGGSAAAVAAGVVPLALGSDTAGSVRVPAAWCDVVGFKAGPDSIPTEGCAPLAAAFDSVGVLARSVDDCALAAAVLSGRPELEAAAEPSSSVTGLLSARQWGVPEDVDLRLGWERWSAALEDGGHDVVSLGREVAAPGFGRLLAAEFAAVWRDRLATEDVDPAIRLGIERGSAIDIDELAEARGGLALAGADLLRALHPHGLLVTPTSPVGPPPLGEVVDVRLASRFTRPLSAFGWPAISVPVRASGGLGLQIAAPPGRDSAVLAFAAGVERALSSFGSPVE